MDTVRIEFMLINQQGAVVQNWTNAHGSVQNDPQIYLPRAVSLRNMQTSTYSARVRVVSEQTNRIVDILP